MAWRALWNDELVRLRLLLIVMLSALGLLAANLWRMQLSQGALYRHSLQEQSIRRVRTPGARGRILARDGTLLADNKPSYQVVLYLEELRQPGRGWRRTIQKVEAVIQDLARLLQLPPQIGREDIQNHISKRLPLPLVAWRNIGDLARARLAERAGAWPGVDVIAAPLRIYPEGALAAHILGYVGRADPPQDEDASYNYYEVESSGKAGIEKRYDRELHGVAGEKVVPVDVSGFHYRHPLPAILEKFKPREAAPGRDVILALDLPVQRRVEQALANWRGAAVVVNPANGDVLAMASSPAYDPNELAAGIAPELWRALLADPHQPLVHRALSGLYSPGSTFKPVVALAALESGRATPALTFTCPGYFKLGQARFDCWENRAGHGAQNLHQALEHSCNVYFFNLGLRCGPAAIHDMALQFGFGRKTGIELGGDMAGLAPDDAWKRQERHDGWRDGDTCNLAIGQGALNVTPLQMAMFAAALANGGKVYQPRLVLGVRDPAGGAVLPPPPRLRNTVAVDPAYMRVVREGLRAVVNSPTGTGRKAALEQFVVAGKTGTAEHGVKGEGKKWAWMIAFAPYEQPRYALAVLVEEGVSGGSTVAPLVHDILYDLLARPGSLQGEG
ncbi:MAG: penicillin-binding protein 2 [Kiritimatiellaeota bacterium]|nr:penicillin-binding protein 2 [Kiritimatiellota bacterium]